MGRETHLSSSSPYPKEKTVEASPLHPSLLLLPPTHPPTHTQSTAPRSNRLVLLFPLTHPPTHPTYLSSSSPYPKEKTVEASPLNPSLLLFPNLRALYLIETVSPCLIEEEEEGAAPTVRSRYLSPVVGGWVGGWLGGRRRRLCRTFLCKVGGWKGGWVGG